MRIIIDTNIFIPLEDSGIDFNENFSIFTKLVSGTHELLIHPASIDDIKRDKNHARKRSMLQRVNKYNILEAPPEFTDDEEEAIFGAPNKANDTVDNLILFSVIRNCAHFFVTEDSKLLKKANAKGVGDRVLSLEQACELLDQKTPTDDIKLVNIEDIPCHKFDVNNTFFDSLRESYSGFNNWFTKKCAQSGRRAWICGSVNSINAVCIYKHEKNPVVTNDNKKLLGSGLKLCTFKVKKNGLKLGELLIKKAFDYADSNKLDFTYLTVDETKHNHLIQLISDFGFYPFGVDEKNRDSVYVKDFINNKNIMRFNSELMSLKPLEFAIKYYPAVKISNVNVYLIPVAPQFHNRLFPDIVIQHPLFPSYEDSVGNAIKQAYICNSPIKSINQGDIVFFYRSGDQKVITTYGVVDSFLIEHDVNAVVNLVKRRTVYSKDNIASMINNNGVKVILFRRARHIKPISFQQLKKLGIILGAIQSIQKLNRVKIETLVKEANINDCFLSN